MTGRARAAALLVAVANLCPAIAAAQATVTVTLSPPDVDFPTATELDFEVGQLDHGGVSVSVDAAGNRPWRLYARSVDGNLGGYGKPLSDLLVRVQGSASWIPISTADQEIATGRGPQTLVLFFRIRLDLTRDSPALYQSRLAVSAR